MYWWNVDSLTDELKEGTLSEKEKMKYLLARSILTIVGLSLVSSLPREASYINILRLIAEVAITVVGILLCFTANGGTNGRDFIERFVCLHWPVGIRVVVYSLLPLIVLFILVGVVKVKVERERFDLILLFAYAGVTSIWVFLWIRRRLIVISTSVNE